MSKYQDLSMDDVTGGLNTAHPATQIQDNEFTEALNLEYDEEGDLTTRLGVEQFNSETTTFEKISVLKAANFDQPTFVEIDTTNNRAYVGNKGAIDAVYIIDISVAGRPTIISVFTHADIVDPRGCAFTSTNLFVACSFSGKVVVVDITDPEDPGWVAAYTSTYTDDAWDCILDGTDLYVANGDTGTNPAIVCLDVTTPASPSLQSQIITGEGGYNLALDSGNNRLYVTNYSTDYLYIVNITTPGSISLAASFTHATNLNGAYGVEVDNDYIYVACRDSDQISIIDRTNETTLTLHGSITSTRLNGVEGISLVGGVLLCACYLTDFLTMVNVADETNPQITATIYIAGGTNGINRVAATGTTAYITADLDDCFAEISLGAPSPFEMADNDTYDAAILQPAQWGALALSPNGQWALMVDGASQDRTLVWNVSDPEDISVVAEHAWGVTASGDFPASLAINSTGTRVYVWGDKAAGGQGVLQINQFNETSGFLTELAETAVAAGGSYGQVVMVTDSYVACAASSGSAENVIIIDVSSDTVSVVKTIAFGVGEAPGWLTYDEANKTLFVSELTGGTFKIFDMTDPEDPQLLYSGTETIDKRMALEAVRETGTQILYGVDSGGGGSTITAYNVYDPTSPTVVGTITPPISASIYDLWLHGTRLYANLRTDDGFIVINVNDPENMVQEATYLNSTYFNEPSQMVTTSDGKYLIGSNYDRLTTVNAEITQAFSLLHAIHRIPLNGAFGVDVSQSVAYVAAVDDDAVCAIDISDPTTPIVRDYIVDATNLNGAAGLVVGSSGDYAYVACSLRDSLAIIDIQDPDNLSRIGEIQSATALNGVEDVVVTADEDFAYVSSPDGKLNVIDIRDKVAPSIVATKSDATNYSGLSQLRLTSDEDYLVGVASTADAIIVWDVTFPFAPRQIGYLADATNLNNVENFDLYDDDWAYCCSQSNNTVAIIDLSDKENPAWDSNIASMSDPQAIDAQEVDDLLYVGTNGDTTLHVFDISTPNSPSLFTTITKDTAYEGIRNLDANGYDIATVANVADAFTVTRVKGMPIRNTVTSIVHFQNEQGADEIITTEGTNILRHSGSGVLESVKGTLTIPNGNYWEWSVLDGVLFGVNGGDPATYNNPVYWDGETAAFQSLTDFPSAETNPPKHIAVWNSRLFILAGSTLYYSKLGDGTNFSDTLAGSIEIYPDDGDVTTGLVVHRSILFIFKKKHIYRILPGVPNTADAKWSVERVTSHTGALSGHSVQSLLNDLIFLGPAGINSLQAAEEIGDFRSALLSEKIAELRELPLDAGTFPSVVHKAKSQYWISVDEDRDGTLDAVWVLDYKRLAQGQARWTKWDGGIIGNAYALVEQDGRHRIFIGNSNGLFRLKLASDASPYNDAGAAYTARFKTKKFDMGMPLNRKELNRWAGIFEKLTSNLTLTVKLYWDDSGTAAHTWTLNCNSLSNTFFEINRKLGTKRRFARFIFEVSNATADEAFSLEKVGFEITPLSKKHVKDV